MRRIPYRLVRTRTGSVTDGQRFISPSAAGKCADYARPTEASLGYLAAGGDGRRRRADGHAVAAGPAHGYALVLDLRGRLSGAPMGFFAVRVARLRPRSMYRSARDQSCR